MCLINVLDIENIIFGLFAEIYASPYLRTATEPWRLAVFRGINNTTVKPRETENLLKNHCALILYHFQPVYFPHYIQEQTCLEIHLTGTKYQVCLFFFKYRIIKCLLETKGGLSLCLQEILPFC